MDLIIKPRGKGKTKELIKRSYETNTYILTSCRKRADNIFRMADEMGYDILNPVTVEDYRRTHGFQGSYIKNILIDDADDVLRCIFNRVTIDAITMTQEDKTDVNSDISDTNFDNDK